MDFSVEEMNIEDFFDCYGDKINALSHQEGILSPFDSSIYWLRFCYRSFWSKKSRIVVFSKPSALLYFVYTKKKDLLPIDIQWGYSCPILATTPDMAVDTFIHFVRIFYRYYGGWIAGIRMDSMFDKALNQLSIKEISLMRVPGQRIAIINLQGGIDAFFQKRTAGFRRNIRRALRKCDRHGVEFRFFKGKEARIQSWAQTVSVETKSWKYQWNQRHINFYRKYKDVFFLLRERGALRLGIAYIDSNPIAYYLGAIYGNCFRGLQMSFDWEYQHLGVGNALHYKMIESMVEEGVEWYNMGEDLPYKSQWTDQIIASVRYKFDRNPLWVH